MAHPESDSLVKPDMIAVLERTHYGNTLHNFLLPVLEAISNALHGIEDKFKDPTTSSQKGRIRVSFYHPNDLKLFKVNITDNGVGLTPDNFKAFKTPFSGHKLDRKGRGFGRFVSFKVFRRVRYSSLSHNLDNLELRTFYFDLNEENEFIYTNDHDELDETGVSVTLEEPLPRWEEHVNALTHEAIANEIASHFLPHFLYGWLPKILISFGDTDPIDLRDQFQNVFVQADSGEVQCEIEGSTETVQFSIARVPRTASFKSHCLLFSAADRIVGAPRDISNKIGEPYFINDKGEKYIIIAVVHSDAFENRLDDSRSRINIPASAIETIVSLVSARIETLEEQQIEAIKKAQSVDLEGALRENPILRAGLRGRTVQEYVKSKPNNWTPEQFISDLAIERYRVSANLSRDIAKAAANPEDYAQKLQALVTQLDRTKKDALAEYVLHRKSIIELVESARKYTCVGDHSPEDRIHELIFRRFSDNTETDYFQHNLWLVDDVLAFLPYISSDRTLHGGKRSKGDKVADLAFFDDSMVLGDENATTVVIVEFKRPSRDDYRFGNLKTDPVMQTVATLRQATTAGGITKTDGTHISFENVTRRFGFIIADLTPSLISVLKDHDFKNEWNPNIWFRFRENEQVYIQCFGYAHLVEVAKKRNQAFFQILLDE